MADGSARPIDDIRVGDLVVAGDPATGEVTAQPVLAVITGYGDKHLVQISTETDLSASGPSITPSHAAWTATSEHPVHVAGAGWTHAENLQPGDTVGVLPWVRTVTHIRDYGVRTSQLVYNLSVANAHTYMVGNGDLVHNCSRIHGNSLDSPKHTTFYRLEKTNGDLIKWGITSNMNRRYTKTWLSDKRLIAMSGGSRREMAALERYVVMRHPGPSNNERWKRGRIE
jgi:hypothetical protein